MTMALRIAVMSDLHADRRIPGTSGAAPPMESHLDVDMSEANVSQHPIRALESLIDAQSLRADLLICPGDITHKAKPEPLQYAWRRVHDIGKKLGVSAVVATAGNHDVDSRYAYNDHDARGMMQGLVPLFPLSDPSANDHFWARHYVVLERDKYRLVILNSSAYHGGEPEEIKHGRVARRTIDALRSDIVEAQQKNKGTVLNILVCHHHPQRHPGVSIPDYEAMVLGPDLLELLGSGDLGRWLVIHGHKHNPRLTYAGGTASSAVVFSAGSFSVVLYPELQNRARNQFYILEAFPDDVPTQGVVGLGRAWDFVPGQGWVPAGAGSGLPAHFGFGSRIDPNVWASRLAAGGAPFREWSDVVVEFPDLQYVLPSDLRAIERALDSTHAMVITWANGKPYQIGQKT